MALCNVADVVRHGIGQIIEKERFFQKLSQSNGIPVSADDIANEVMQIIVASMRNTIFRMSGCFIEGFGEFVVDSGAEKINFNPYFQLCLAVKLVSHGEKNGNIFGSARSTRLGWREYLNETVLKEILSEEIREVFNPNSGDGHEVKNIVSVVMNSLVGALQYFTANGKRVDLEGIGVFKLDANKNIIYEPAGLLLKDLMVGKKGSPWNSADIEHLVVDFNEDEDK